MYATFPSIASLGTACQWWQVTPQMIRDAAEVLGISPTIRINGIDHFSESDLDRIAAYLHLRTKETTRHDRA